MIPKDFKTLGFQQMHPMQVEAFMELIGIALNLASNSGDMEVLDEVEAYCDEIVKLFGGNGVQVTLEVDPGTNLDGSQSVH